MTYDEYIGYHKRGDASIEERLVANVCKRLNLDEWNSFRLIYLYSTVYHLPSAIKLLYNQNLPKSQVIFRTDRRYVRIGNTYERLLAELTPERMVRLKNINTTKEAYDYVCSWYFFGRYAAYLFLEVYKHLYPDRLPIDDLVCGWEKDENYTNGAALLAQSCDKKALNNLLTSIKRDTGDNTFAIETSLCAVWKMHKKGLTEGYCAERTIKIAYESEFANFLIPMIK